MSSERDDRLSRRATCSSDERTVPVNSVSGKPTAVIRWFAVVAWAGVIFYASSRTGSSLPGGYSVQGHLIEYFVFGALLCWALQPRRTADMAAALAVVLASLYGMTDEFHQHFVIMRTPDVTDWGVDTIGAFAGAVAVVLMLRWLGRSRTAHNLSQPGVAGSRADSA